MDIKIESISTIPFNGFTALKRESQLEGFYFLEMLEAEVCQGLVNAGAISSSVASSEGALDRGLLWMSGFNETDRSLQTRVFWVISHQSPIISLGTQHRI